MTNQDKDYNDLATIKALRLCAELLDPEKLGHAVSAEVRDRAREVFGIPKCETSPLAHLMQDDEARN